MDTINEIVTNTGVQVVFGLFVFSLGFACLVIYAKKNSDK